MIAKKALETPTKSLLEVHLVDGTYELFRHFFAVPSSQTADGREFGAIRGVLNSILSLLADGATHIAVATDHVVQSFRNEMWDGYKDGSDLDPDIAVQFGPLEEALVALGVCTWPMMEFEADDGLAAGAALAATDSRVGRVLVCTPDKDLAQCVGGKVFQWDRRKNVVYDTAGVREKFGVSPESIPDYLALVGDTADGFPGLPGWGAKSAAAVLGRYIRLEGIPADAADWDVTVRGAQKLAVTLADQRELALLFRQIATVRTDAPLRVSVSGGALAGGTAGLAGAVTESIDELCWVGPSPEFSGICEQMRSQVLAQRADALAQKRVAGMRHTAG